ncbi:MAG TPA: FKBP-type peptidyl-prolyl cis-trans isomerase [Bacteroidales bacterium]|nr:FKBP-type peptidyl-prolyl cis-trans isomerase [Bacteroidales bacterium]HQG36764.1 FKBP-type peptidyl-prolyl cis-trans isomerase [Bacteroidales bacterium]HQG53816.1 FKBP-type peptidyl-prolyl cis-trans isomerase [Bacteroidales bacterium]HQJ21643.1 FKBP-type peptidyl-prolyl cis-trans isomerase [Bacteroidales bacterium]
MKTDFLNKTFSFLCVILLILITESCNNKGGKDVNKIKPADDDLAAVNSYLVQKDRERILNYIERRNLKMVESPSGLWYYIKKSGEGEFLKNNDTILMEYNCFLLDGTMCYSSDDTGPKSIVIGKSRIEPGLNEGFRLLRRGGEAIFILPPHLAWGFHGDDKSIPPRATVVYEIKILNKNNGEKPELSD